MEGTVALIHAEGAPHVTGLPDLSRTAFQVSRFSNVVVVAIVAANVFAFVLSQAAMPFAQNQLVQSTGFVVFFHFNVTRNFHLILPDGGVCLIVPPISDFPAV
jgi:hypothetical protein